MAKVSKKTEKITAFGGIFFVMDRFDRPDRGQVLVSDKRHNRAPVRILNAGIAEMRAIVMFLLCEL